MQAVMGALAEKCAQRGIQTFVCPDHAPPATHGNYDVIFSKQPKLWRSSVKRFLLSRHLHPEDMVICDSWKSVAAVPRGHKNITVLAMGQEYLKSEKQLNHIRNALARASHFVAISQYTLALAETIYPLDGVKKTVIPPTYMLPDDAPPLRARTKNAPVHIVSIGRLEERKGVRLTIEALYRLRDKLPAYRWSIIGDGPQAAEVRALAGAKGLEENITFLGAVDDAVRDDMLKHADLFLMPSYRHGRSVEGFGIVYVEAARFGVPAFAGCEGGMVDAVTHEKTGWTIDPTDEAELDKALLTALENHKMRRKFGKAAQQAYLENFTGAHVFHALCEHIFD